MLCPHIRIGVAPFKTLYVLEEHLGLARGLVQCHACAATYLLELIDLVGNTRAYRVAEVDSAHAQATVRTLSRGSCDINRAEGEVQHLESRSSLLPVVVAMEGGLVTGLRQLNDLGELPLSQWRDLPCDGQWLAFARIGR